MHVLRWLLAALLITAPAQALSAELDVWREPLLPEVPVTMSGFVTANCDELIHPVNGDLTGGGIRTAYLEFEAPPGIEVTAPSEVHFDRTSCLPTGQEVHLPIDVEVVATEVLTALEVHRISYTLTWSDGSLSWENQFIVQMEYLPGFELKVIEESKTAGPQQQISYEVEIRNLANGVSKFEFNTFNRDLEGDALTPPPLILDAAGGPTDMKRVLVTYVTPFENGSNHITENFTMEVRQSFVFDETRKGPTQTFDLEAETEGVYVPGPGAFLFPALLVAALVARRR